MLMVPLASSVCCHHAASHPDASPDSIGVAATARLIAPPSMASVAQTTPTLRWMLSVGAGAPVVDLCRDRACAQPLPITIALAADRSNGVPTTPLPAGPIFWRVRVVQGAQTT